jgi:hypothetical protein
LLRDPLAVVLAGVDGADRIVAGGVAYDAAGALGVTNLFGPEPEFLQALDVIKPARDIVCYAHGAEQRAAEAVGFRALGPLRIWVRGP